MVRKDAVDQPKEYEALRARDNDLEKKWRALYDEQYEIHFLGPLEGLGLGLPSLYFGMRDQEMLLVIFGTALTTLGLTFGIPAWRKYCRLDDEIRAIRKAQRLTQERMKELEEQLSDEV